MKVRSSLPFWSASAARSSSTGAVPAASARSAADRSSTPRSSSSSSSSPAVIGEQAAEAARLGARIVVFPEAAMARFGIPLGPLAQPLDGPWATAVRDIAAERDVLIVAGMFTPSDDGRVRNTLLVTGLGVD